MIREFLDSGPRVRTVLEKSLKLTPMRVKMTYLSGICVTYMNICFEPIYEVSIKEYTTVLQVRSTLRV